MSSLNNFDPSLLSPVALRALSFRLDAEACRRSLATFVRLAWPILEPRTTLEWGRHLDALCLHLEAVSSGQIKSLIITIPPRSGKSTVVSALWPVWEWLHRPHTRFLTASYAQSLSTRDALRSRRVLESPWFESLWNHFGLAADANLKQRYENEETGYRIATSVGGGATGEGGDILIVDDAHNVIEAESAATLEMTRLWWDEAFSNRLNDARTGRWVIIGQRVGTGDLIGHVLRQGGCEELRLPEEFEAASPSSTSLPWTDWRTEEGELLRPERFGPAQVARAKRVLGSHAYASQHQQRPVPREGALYKAEWFKNRYEDLGDGWHVRDRFIPYKDCTLFVVMDPAGGVSASADHTAIGTFAVTPFNDLLVADMVRERIPLEGIPNRLLTVAQKWRPSFVAIEKGFLQNAIIREAMRLPGMPPVRSLDTEGQRKLARSIAALTLAESGQLWLPDAAPWLPDMLEEMLRFTGSGNDARDDIADVVAYAARLREEVSTVGAGVPLILGQRGVSSRHRRGQGDGMYKGRSSTL